jgi:cytochrome c551/c552
MLRAGRRVARVLLVVVAVAALADAAPAAEPGSGERGRELFTSKQCGRCHLPAGQRGVGPSLDRLRRAQGAYAFAGRLWNHVPAMFTVLTQEELAWPSIEPSEMGALMVYLGADPARDPAPDRLRGQRILVAKGCLKCHAYGGEGARVGPDLADRRMDYAPAATWAATIWRHTPRMAVVAMQRGVPYPRFTEDEMAHLLGFLGGGP